MAHTKAQGAANRTVNVEGKRLGLKKHAGQKVISGNIIVRQRGSVFHPGLNTKMGKDFTIFATEEGFVHFRNMTKSHRDQKFVDVLSTNPNKPVVKTAVKSSTKTKKVQ